MNAIRDSLAAGVRGVFWISAVTMLLAFLLICTLPVKSRGIEVDVKGIIMHRLEIRVIAKDRETGFTRTAFIINGEAFGKKDLQMIKDALENAKRDIERARELARGVRHGNDKEV